MLRLLALLVFGLMASLTAAAQDAVPVPIYALPATAPSATRYPLEVTFPLWEPMDTLVADLNKDSIPDYVLLFQEKESELPAKGRYYVFEDGEIPEEQNRLLLVYVSEKSGIYFLRSRCDRCIGNTREGVQIYTEPILDMSISSKGILTIVQQYGGAGQYGTWTTTTHKYRYQNTGMYLIGYTEETYEYGNALPNPGSGYITTDENYLTGQYLEDGKIKKGPKKPLRKMDDIEWP